MNNGFGYSKYLLKSLTKISIGLILNGLIGAVTLTAQNLNRFSFSERLMGTDVNITFYAADKLTADKASNKVFERIEELDRILSDYKKDSNINELSASSASGRSFKVDPSLFFVLKKSVAVSEITGGAFDVTVGPYVRLWRKTRQTQRLPTENELQQAKKSVGYNKIKLNEEDQSIQLLSPHMQLDVGGIGKGYAADEALKVLSEQGIFAAVIDAGGDVVAGAPPPGTEGWRVGLEMIDDHGNRVSRILTICNRAVATSGDLYQHIVIGGKQYSHIINPATGLGMTDQSRVSVLAPDGITADSFASAISVLGPQQGKRIVRDVPGVDFYFIRRVEDGLRSWHSNGFEKNY